MVSHLKATCRPALPLEVTRRIAISPAGVLVSVSSSTTACATTLQDPLVSSHHQGGSDERQRRRTHVTPRHHGRTIVPHGCLNLDAHNVEWIFNFSQPGDIVDVRYAGSLPGSVGVVGHAGSAMAILTVDGEKGWNHLTCGPCSLVNSSITSKEGSTDVSVGRFHGFDWSFLGRGRCRGQVSDLPFACPEGAPRLAGQGWPKAIAARRVSALDA